MAPFYELICEEQGWTVDTDFLNKMKAENEEGLKKLDEKLKDAEENLGETEISDTLLARAEHFAKIGDKVHVVGETMTSTFSTTPKSRDSVLILPLSTLSYTPFRKRA